MDAALVHIQHAPARETVRDARGTIVGTIERQRHTRKQVARDARGAVVAVYEERSRTTRDAHGRLVGRANLLGALLWQG
jgi:YD repeat-containing protein